MVETIEHMKGNLPGGQGDSSAIDVHVFVRCQVCGMLAGRKDFTGELIQAAIYTANSYGRLESTICRAIA